MSKKVVITGIGMVSPLANTFPETWQAIMDQKVGVGPITGFDTSLLKVKNAFEVKNFECSKVTPDKRKRYTKFLQYAIMASDEALNQSKLNITNEIGEKMATVIGSGIGGSELIESCSIVAKDQPSKVTPFFVPFAITNMASGLVSEIFKIKGINLAITTACASGTHSIGYAYQLIKSGMVDYALAGGAEGCINKVVVAGFQNAQALSLNQDPTKMSIPFDENRSGFAIGEGACVLVMETEESALKRNATILAEIVGFGATSDAHHITMPAPKGEGAQRAMKMAIDDAKIDVKDIDYISAHGTSTNFNDLHESEAIDAIFKNHKPFVSSTKNATGHCIGAVGAMETAFCVQVLLDQKAPTNYSSKNLDPELTNLVNLTEEKDKYNYCLTNSFGFGGHNACLVIKKYN